MAETGRAGRFSGRYGRYLLPAVIFQSVLIGGGYATGREIVAYGAKYGVLGVWSIVALFVGFAVIAVVTYEFARVTGSYNYRSMMRRLIGPAWPLFDVLFVVMAVIIIAVVSSAAGELGQQIIGLPYLAGVGLVILIAAVLNFYGRRLLEPFKSTGTTILYLLYIVLAAAVLSARWQNVQEVFATADTSYVDSATVLAAVGTGFLYVGYNLAVMPATFFSLDRQERPRETVTAGLLTGVLAGVPFVLTYLCLLSFYPSDNVLGAPVPWLAMLQGLGTQALVLLFAVVVIYTLVETATGLTHAMVDRIDDTLAELGKPRLTRMRAALFTGGVLIAAAILSQVGIIALVATGYGIMAYVFLALFALPLLTVGLYVIVKSRRRQRVPTEPA